MGLAKLKTKIGVGDYLKGELINETRHEYIYGEVFAMAGASDRHNRIAANIFSRIDNHLENSKCEIFIENVKLKADAQTFYYPDVMVACDEPPPSPYYREQPILLVEVLSPTTERTDRNEKLVVYKNISTVREYLIVSQEKVWVEVYRRLEGGVWQAEIYDETNSEVRLDSVDYNLSVKAIYRRVNLQSSDDRFLQ